MPSRLLPAVLVLPLLSLASAAQAHPGHAAPAAWHWHASDTAGLFVVAGLACIALWLARGR
jgi:hypothetical protein